MKFITYGRVVGRKGEKAKEGKGRRTEEEQRNKGAGEENQDLPLSL